jgi:hypothetical protein
MRTPVERRGRVVVSQRRDMSGIEVVDMLAVGRSMETSRGYERWEEFIS